MRRLRAPDMAAAAARPSIRRPILAALLGAGLLAGCVPSTSDVEARIERALPKAIGPAAAYTVEIEGLRKLAGTADRVAITGERVRLPGAPVVDRLAVVLRDVAYDRGARRIERVASARATARVLPADLLTLLAARDGLRQPSMRLAAPDRVTVRALPSFRGVTLPRGVFLESTGRLLAENGALRVDVTEVSAAGVSVGRLAVGPLERALNPLVDLSGLRGRPRITGVRVAEDALTLDLSADLNGITLR